MSKFSSGATRDATRISGLSDKSCRLAGGADTRDTDRQTDSLNWDTNPHTPRLYCKPAPPLHLPRHNDLLGLHRLITGMEKVLRLTR